MSSTTAAMWFPTAHGLALAAVMASAVVGVVGGSGGAGATTFAAALACAADGPAVLLDLDVVGAGLDVTLGLEAAPGARWSALQLGGGRLDPEVLDQGLLHWGDVRVLADPRDPPSGEAVEQVLAAACELGLVVIDVGRSPGPGRDVALQHCDLIVVVTVGAVGGIAAARRVIEALPHVSIGAVVRRGPVRSGDAAELLGVPVLAGLADSLRPEIPVPPSWVRIARGVLAGLSLGVP